MVDDNAKCPLTGMLHHFHTSRDHGGVRISNGHSLSGQLGVHCFMSVPSAVTPRTRRL